MEKVSPKDYIRIQRRICSVTLINAANKLADRDGIPPTQLCFNLLCKAIITEYNKIEKPTTINS